MKIKTTQITLDDALVENTKDAEKESAELKEKTDPIFFHEKQEPPAS